MKLFTTIVAGLAALTGVAVAAPASAQGTVVRERTVVTPAGASSRTVVRERTTVRRSYGYRRAPRRVCTVRYRRGERIRTCRYRWY